MNYYFKLSTETIIKVNAANLEQAQTRIDMGIEREEFDLDYERDIKCARVRKTNKGEEIDIDEEIDCKELVYDCDTDEYLCPMCSEPITYGDAVKELDTTIPGHCPECGAKLHLC